MMEVIMEYRDLPSAWNALAERDTGRAGHAEAQRDDPQRGHADGCFMVSVALKMLTSVPEWDRKMLIPSSMMHEA